MCLDVDPDTLVGTCRAACLGSPFDAYCADAEISCLQKDTYFAWCVPS
jgi:hypothetical protein